MKMRPMMDGIKNVSGVLVLSGIGAAIGLYDSFVDQNNLSNREYFTNGLYLSILASGVNYALHLDTGSAIEVGGAFYAGHIIDQTIGESVKRLT